MEKHYRIGKGISGSVDIYIPKSPLGSKSVYVVKNYEKREKHESFSEYKTRIIHEYDILNRLNHRNIVKVSGFHTNWITGNAWMTMEYGGPQNLKAAMKLVDFNPELLLCYIRQVASGIEYLHNLHICHRDIKFDNVMVTKKGTVKIIDFVDARDHFDCMGIVGTELFTAPEVFEKLKYNGSKADIWCFGIITYYTVAHQQPWKVARKEDTLYDQYFTSGNLPFTGKITIAPEIIEFLTLTLSPEPASRPNVNQLRSNSWFSSIPFCGESKCPAHR